MLAELSRREKASNIKPDPDIDVFMKVWEESLATKSSLVWNNPLLEKFYNITVVPLIIVGSIYVPP